MCADSYHCAILKGKMRRERVSKIRGNSIIATEGAIVGRGGGKPDIGAQLCR